MEVYSLLTCFTLLVCCHGSQLCSNTNDLNQHIKTAFSYKRSYLQQPAKDRTFNYITNIFNEIATQTNGEAYNHTFLKIYDNMERPALNAVLILKGQRWGTSLDQISLLGTHYDSVTGSPGVDDNGSSSAALLEVAKAVGKATCSRLNSVIFVMFDWEEYLLSGSKAFVDGHLVPAILERNNVVVEQFAGAFILDSLLNFDEQPNTQTMLPGFDILFPEAADKVRANNNAGDFVTSIGREDDQHLMALLQKNFNGSRDGRQKFRVIDVAIPFSGRPSDSPLAPLVRDLFRSDHYRFWNYEGDYSDVGLKAVFLTDTTEFRGYMSNCYHQECDNENHVTPIRLQFILTVTNALTNSLLELATGGATCKC